jgi:hypothetical protein
MLAVSHALPLENTKAKRTILWGGLSVGVLDITAAFVTNGLRGISPIRILQSIASGLLGVDSYKGGFTTAALGLFLHFTIATGAATVYYLVSRKLKFLAEQAIVCGLLYGVAVYWFMNLIVLPLSAFPHKISYALGKVVTGLIVHMLCVGLPISLTVRRFSK